MITKVIHNITSGKAAGLSGIAAEMLMPLREAVVVEVRDLVRTSSEKVDIFTTIKIHAGQHISSQTINLELLFSLFTFVLFWGMKMTSI